MNFRFRARLLGCKSGAAFRRSAPRQRRFRFRRSEDHVLSQSRNSLPAPSRLFAQKQLHTRLPCLCNHRTMIKPPITGSPDPAEFHKRAVMRTLLRLFAVSGLAMAVLGYQQHANAQSPTSAFNNSNFAKARAADQSHDYTEAMRWWVKVVEEGDGIPYSPNPYRVYDDYHEHALNKSYAQAKTGSYYEKGLGVPQDYRKALYWFQQASNSPQPALGVSEHYVVLYEKVFGVPTESVKYARLLDRLVAEDFRSWAMNQYDPGSMGYVSIEQSSNGVKIVKGYYSYSHGKRGWVEAKFVNDRLSCLHYWDRTDCRAPGEGAGKQMKRAAAEAARNPRPAPSASSESSSPGMLGCHVMKSGAPSIAGIAGCPPWGW